jgi:hypothetical protein
MAKFHGVIGYGRQVEIKPGVYKVEIVEKTHVGDLLQNTRSLQSSDKLNDDINIANEISIVATPYAEQNFHSMKYVEFMGAKWKINKVTVRYPRLILTIGGVYNG